MKACCDEADKSELNNTSASKNQPALEMALVGNPNSGKTTLFNHLTGSRQRTGNWAGVTVERKEGDFHYDNKHFHVVDLPGTYSLGLEKTSVDEKIARQFVADNPNFVYLNIVDASTLQRGLYLTLQLRELGVPTIVVLNMMDIAQKRGMTIDVEQLSSQLDCPVIPISLKQADSVDALYQAIAEYDLSHVSTRDISYSAEIESAISTLSSKQSRIQRLEQLLIADENQAVRDSIEQATGEDLDFLLADSRFEQAMALSKKVVKERGKITRTSSDKVDKWVLGNWTGIPIFIALMYLLFLFSINFGGALIDFFDLSAQAIFVDGGRAVLSNLGSPEWLITILADGIGGGIQVVATFIPIIAALFLFLTLLEESGYMARAAFVIDRSMRKLGVSGKAFVPLIIGFGCNVPGIMATRTLSNERERILTVMMSPFMSCGARLAVFALFAVAFFPVGGQNIVFLLYIVGIAFAVFTAFIFKKTLLKGEVEHFFMELPTYQIPQLKNVLINTWNKLKGFIVGAGKIIVIVVALINVVNSLGTDGSFGHQDSEKSVLSATAKFVTPIFEPMGIHEDNWPATVGIITGLLAKEVVVGTLDTLYSSTDSKEQAGVEDEEPFDLLASLSEAVATIPTNLLGAVENIADPLGLGAIENDVANIEKSAEEQGVSLATFGAMVSRFDGKIGAFAYLLFILLYFPCVAATGAMVREVGAGWATMGVLWSSGLAYVAAVVFYQLATFAAHPTQSILWVSGLLGLLVFTVYMFHLKGKQDHRDSLVRVSSL
ncbi:MAG TPA: Fe(2+) transporter permease subunit FeoB [Leucothrix mucor]|nr:Fe(2+) transporter permease subunit FeoB [Leucothrix mucor]